MEKVYLSYGCFANIVLSSVEAYDKETLGLIYGYKNRNVTHLTTAIPIQLSGRGKLSVGIKDSKKYCELVETGFSLNLVVMGAYHSHPKGEPVLSEGDSRIIRFKHFFHGLSEKDKLLELVVGIRRRKFRKHSRHAPLKCIRYEIFGKKCQMFCGDIKFGRLNYSYEMVGYWVRPKKNQSKLEITEAYLKIRGPDLRTFMTRHK